MTEILLRSASAEYRAMLGAVGLSVHDASGVALEALPESLRRRARILVTSGVIGCTAAEMAALPALGLVACLGTGFEKVDLAAARARGIVVTHGAGANAAAVADHAMALLLAALRRIVPLDRAARAGLWRQGAAPRPIPTGKRLGILGMGAIGERIARRAAGFEMPVTYHARSEKPGLPWAYAPSVLALAEAVDHLVVAVPGGAATRHLVDGAVLRALGPQGILVNVGRGTVVDTQALVAALEAGEVAGAALDVFEEEPMIPATLAAREDVVLTPHVAAWAPEAREATVAMIRDSVARFLRGEAVGNAVPGGLAVAP